ncbi:hypothetical protein IAT40_005182 [Kwoniella sp. CBS 6097]
MADPLGSLLDTIDNGNPIATSRPDEDPNKDKDSSLGPASNTEPKDEKKDDDDDDADDMAAVSQITSASAVSQPTAVVSTSAVATPNPAQPAATSSTSARVQNPATPQNTVATSSSSSAISSAAAVTTSATRALTSSAATSTAVRTSTTSSAAAAATTSRAATSSTTSSARTSSSASRSSVSSSASKTSSISSSASATKVAAEGKGGVGGSGLSIGALIGIIAGSVVGLILIAMVVTRTVRKKQRRDRAARRSSMFEWPATGMDEEPYEKPRYDPPSQSYAMSDSYNNSNSNPAQTVSYMTNETSYAPVPAAAATGPANSQSYMERNNPQHAYPSYPPQQQQQQQYGQQQYPTYQENVVPPAAAGAGAAAGLRDASWVRVKVGFVRSLEDELAISPGQQLYLHTAYDDGWSLCEDAKQNRGVVPISCLEPWSDSPSSSGGLAPTSMSREGSTGSAGSGERLQRRSSLYRGDQ